MKYCQNFAKQLKAGKYIYLLSQIFPVALIFFKIPAERHESIISTSKQNILLTFIFALCIKN